MTKPVIMTSSPILDEAANPELPVLIPQRVIGNWLSRHARQSAGFTGFAAQAVSVNGDTEHSLPRNGAEGSDGAPNRSWHLQQNNARWSQLMKTPVGVCHRITKALRFWIRFSPATKVVATIYAGD